MRKISVVLATLFLSLGLVIPTFAQDVTFPQSDFFLYLGVRNMGADQMPGERTERILFSSASVDTKSGTVEADRSIPISFTMGNQGFTGTASIKMNGDYDKSDGHLSGTFSIILDMTDVWHGAVSDIKAHWVADTQGSFTGQVVNDQVVIRYMGNTSEERQQGMADGSVENNSSSLAYSSIVVWRLSEYGVPETPDASVGDKVPVDSGARFSGMTGQVEWRADDDPDGWKLCKPGTKLPVFAHIRTLEDSSAILSFSDMSTFVLKPDSEVVIDSPPEKESKVKLVAGNIWVNLKKMVQDGSMEIEMNQAVAGIKGTTLIASQIGDSSVFKLIEGNITVSAKNGTESVDLTGGQMAGVDSAGKITQEDFEIVEELNTWDKPEKLDFAALEKMIPAEKIALKTGTAKTESAGDQLPPKPVNTALVPPVENNQPLIIYLPAGGIVLAGIILMLVFRKKK